MHGEKSDIEKRVYETYPATKKERECAQEKRRMDNLRKLLRKRLRQNGVKEKREYK